MAKKEKWWQIIYTEKYVLEEMKVLLNSLKSKPDIIFLWELFEDKPYARQRFSERVTTYSDNKEIVHLSDTIKGILETRAAKWGMMWKLNPTMTIFHLKNNFNWKDKIDIDTNQKIDVNFDNWKTEDLLKELKSIGKM